MPVEAGQAIARRAAELLGTPFRLHGRTCEGGLDCVGVLSVALACTGHSFAVPCDYTLRGEYPERIKAFFDQTCFHALGDQRPLAGDLLLCRPAERQLHLGIFVSGGIIHAHAGLRRVALTPLPVPWPVIGRWRYIL